MHTHPFDSPDDSFQHPNRHFLARPPESEFALNPVLDGSVSKTAGAILPGVHALYVRKRHQTAVDKNRNVMQHGAKRGYWALPNRPVGDVNLLARVDANQVTTPPMGVRVRPDRLRYRVLPNANFALNYFLAIICDGM